MKSLTSVEHHLRRLRGLRRERRSAQEPILSQYIMRNALLPQITGLALQLGMIFSGALIMEVVFGYPGMGTLTFQARVAANDYSLIMGLRCSQSSGWRLWC